MRQVAIFRHNLFKISEPFITQQAQKLRHGVAALPSAGCVTARRPADADSAAMWWIILVSGSPIPAVARQMLTRNPAPYQRLLNGRRPALIHAHFGVEGVYALPLAQRLGIPLVTTYHVYDATLSTAALLSNPAWVNYALFRGRLARQGDLFLCASNFIRQSGCAGYGVFRPRARTRRPYWGARGAIMPRDAAEELPVILHVARLEAVKGTAYLIRAFAAVAATQPAARLVIIGEGKLRGRLEALAGACGVAARVDFLGRHAACRGAWLDASRRRAGTAQRAHRPRAGRGARHGDAGSRRDWRTRHRLPARRHPGGHRRR